MIGLVKLTDPNNKEFYVNPQYIQFFATPDKGICSALGLDWDQCYQKGTIMICGGARFQCSETPNHIINALTRLRRKQEKNMINLVKQKEREDWEGDEEEV